MKVVSTHRCTFSLEEIMALLTRELEAQGYTPVSGMVPQESRVNGQVVWVIEAVSVSDNQPPAPLPTPGMSNRDANGNRLKKDGTIWKKPPGKQRKAVANPTADPLSE